MCQRKLSQRKTARKTHVCSTCITKQQCVEFGKRTKGELIIESQHSAAKHRYEKIRQHAKRTAKCFNWNSTKCCEFCAYSQHTELCHKTPIHRFPDQTPISEINDRSNILFLCPNCHYEFDHKHVLGESNPL